jgi:hypothetical protein
MRNVIFLFFIFSVLGLSADQKNVTPQQIQAELDQAQSRYNRAKEMFNPWYTGPLVTPSATMMPPGFANLQPYLFVGGNYGAYNKDRQSLSIPHNEYSLQVLSVLLMGVTNSVDFTVTPSGVSNWANHKNGGGFNDLSATVGFCITPQTLYVPAMKFTVTEILPTGKYRNLSSNGLGLNSTGGGSYQSQFGFAISKLIWWMYKHPLNLRWFLSYTIQTAVHVKGFNTYGGGFQTNGTVHPGGTLTTDLGIEWSFTERWVFAMDVVYLAQNKTRFFGKPGFLENGLPAVVGSPYNDNLSLAPAIEYNWNENLGILFGVQFSVYGRSSPTFAKGQFSVSYVW